MILVFNRIEVKGIHTELNLSGHLYVVLITEKRKFIHGIW